ncbi:MAG: hypothetical protein RL456_1582 [Pseudomonadota bacterium]|jgi:glycosyltransferase involved in cell wall biosynthesis
MTRKTLRILGIRGVPAAHGGFETFAEKLALHLVENGWRVVVYCQEPGCGDIVEDKWCGIERVRIPSGGNRSVDSVRFDWRAVRHAARHRDLCLTLGYNTAVFCSVLRLHGIVNLINMDGIEWARAKWPRPAKAWFWLNERLGCWLGNHLIADHPEIHAHLSTRVSPSKISMIAYGAEPLQDVSPEPLQACGLEPGRYLSLVARPEPENSILEVVRGFSSRPRGVQLAVLGDYDAHHPYHAAIRAAAGPEVRFLGAIYDKAITGAIRYHSLAYVHGHQVGGTNPSLVEALGAGNAVIAHDNRFNRWVAGREARYFSDADSFSRVLDELLDDDDQLQRMRRASRDRYAGSFTWPQILAEYERLLDRFLVRRMPVTVYQTESQY